MLDEVVISRSIVESYKEKFVRVLDVDVAIAGGGPAGLVCAYFLAKAGKNVAVFERKLSLGGGMWGGGMLFNEIVVQQAGQEILEEFGISCTESEKGYFLADAVEGICALGYRAVHEGATVMNAISVEDVMVRNQTVCGLVVNWSAVEVAGLHVDPLTIRAKYVVEATGHPCEVVKVVERKSGITLATESGKMLGERSMWADAAENKVLDNTKEVCPGLYVCGMAANAVFGAPRMGPIFGGMVLSGKHAAEQIITRLSQEKNKS
ncbi:MAG: thiazole biosynthesis protein [Candidatus Omnitrophica bacterium]|nr:thiazole biosynthesis protein [Candidatus Omnitrophota bacterium]